MKRLGLVITLLFCYLSSFAAGIDIDSLMQKMSLREKVGQLFIVEYTSGVEKITRRDKIGGIILMESPIEEYGDNLNRLQKISKIPLVTSIDGEWGASMRFDSLTQFPRNMQMGALSSPDLVYEAGKAMATQFNRLGININFAPAVDINNNPQNIVIRARSFGDNREKVSVYGTALMHGLQDGNILTSAKHFPGHGDTDIDSHKALPILPFERHRLDSLELYPFRNLINEGVSMVMVGHLNVPALDSTGTPSSISYPIITELLKKELGFKGIVITDALAMKGVAEYFPAEKVPLESFKAGSDILLMPPHNQHKCIKNVRRAVRRGEISEERLDESVRKILEMKKNLGILDTKPHISSDNIFEDVETPEVLDVIQRISDASVTMIKSPSAGDSLSVLLSKGLADTVTLKKNLDIAYLDSIKNAVSDKEYVIIQIPEFRAQKNNRELFTSVQPEEIYRYISDWASARKIVLVILDSPYVLNYLKVDNFDSIIIGYSSSPANRRAVEKVLKGEIPAKGVLPVSAGGFPTGYSSLL